MAASSAHPPQQPSASSSSIAEPKANARTDTPASAHTAQMEHHAHEASEVGFPRPEGAAAVLIEFPASQTLERNLAVLANRNAELVRKIRHTQPAHLEWSTAADGLRVAAHDGRALASRHAPRKEAEAFADLIDYQERAAAAVLGFGVGHHVAAICDRMGPSGLVIVLETDLALLRAVLSEIDFSGPLGRAGIVFFDGTEQGGNYSDRLAGLESVLIQGLQLVEHAPSRHRLGERARECAQFLTESVRYARSTVATALARSSHTIGSIFRNARHYIGGEGLAPLRGIAAGRLGVVVSAGPSLRRNLHLLAQPGVRDRCLIVATQTVLKPLLKEGIRPHFVASLDWHQISKRFFEGLTERDVRDTTLILDPQANPVVAETFPGKVQVISAPHLDALLGPIARDVGRVPAGSTVAHLCYQIARFLGCDPVALIGQDLGFTDGVYYARGTAIDEIWSPELNPFNTIENLEWTRIMRQRGHLTKLKDIHGRSIYTDVQMEAYLKRFEYFFLQDERKGLRTIDASEGGVRKQATIVKPLAETLAEFATEPLPEIPAASRELDIKRMRAATSRVEEVADHVRVIRAAARKAGDALEQLLDRVPRKLSEDAIWHVINSEREKVSQRLPYLKLIDEYSTIAPFRRAKADRKIEHARGLDELALQKLHAERDLSNVRWIEEASGEYLKELTSLAALLSLPGGPRVAELLAAQDEYAAAAKSDHALSKVLGESTDAVAVTAAFIVPVDPWHGGLGTPRSLAEPLAGRPVIQWTLERLGRSREAERIILLVPEGFDVEALIDRTRIRLPVEVHRTEGSPFGPSRMAIAAARLWSDSSWRGGICGLTCYDEVLAPAATLAAMERFGITAAVLVAPDWPLVAVGGDSGCDALIARHRVRPRAMRIVFNQSPPGLAGVLVERSLMAEFAKSGRQGTIASRLAYEPTRAQPDPITKELCVQIDQTIRRSFVRAVFDTPRNMTRMRRAIEPAVAGVGSGSIEDGMHGIDAAAAVALLEHQLYDTVPYFAPQHLIIELNTGRRGSGACSPHRQGSIQRPVMTERRFVRLLEQIAESRDCVLTLGGAGDPLLHPDVVRFVRLAKETGARGVHIRTELLCEPSLLDELVAAGVDVISAEIDADTPETYRRTHGAEGFSQAFANMQHLFDTRRALAGKGPIDTLATPWIVPRLQRRLESYEDIESFYDRWQHFLGTPVIEGPPPLDPTPEMPADPLASANAPARVMFREMLRRMVVLSDGSVPLSELDLRGEHIFAHVDRAPLLQIWRDLVARRKQIRREHGESHPDLRTRTP
jgi:hypothetical protein